MWQVTEIGFAAVEIAGDFLAWRRGHVGLHVCRLAALQNLCAAYLVAGTEQLSRSTLCWDSLLSGKDLIIFEKERILIRCGYRG